jgi:hypothetical protein
MQSVHGNPTGQEVHEEIENEALSGIESTSVCGFQFTVG